MARRSAHIRSPEVMRRFRHRFVEFDEQALRSLDTAVGDLRSVVDWVKGDQIRYWKLELRRRHDQMKEAWREYVNARYGDRRMGKPSCVDERKAWERAKRRREEAEEKIKKLTRWSSLLEQEAEKLLPHYRRFEELLVRLTPKALARLDFMMDHLADYLRPSPPRKGTARAEAAPPAAEAPPAGEAEAAEAPSSAEDAGAAEEQGQR